MRSFSLLLCLLVATGCPPPPFPEDHLPVYEERPVEALFDSSFNQVWDESLAVFGDRYPIDRVDKAAGKFTTEWVVGSSDYIFNQFSGTRIPEKIRFRMVVDFDQKNGRTRITVRNREQVEKDIISANLTFTGSIYEWLDVPSSCRKERDALEKIADNLGRGDRRKAELDLRAR